MPGLRRRGRFGGFGSVGPRTRRRTSWEIGPEAVGITRSTAGSTIFTTGSAIALDGLTLVRLRGHGLLLVQAADVANEGAAGAMGVALLPTAAVAAGVGSLPSPYTDEGAEFWLWHQFFSVRRGNLDPAEVCSVQRFEVDSRAMRKTHIDTTVVGILEIADVFGTATIQLDFYSRMLVKLP